MIRLLGELFLLSHERMTHPYDAQSYLLAGPEPTLIDCGGALGYDALKRELAACGYLPCEIARVIGTHGHWDHLSAMASLRAESDATLALHPADAAAVEAGDPERTAAFLYGRTFPAVRVDEPLRDGAILHVNGVEIHVVHTPGHTPGSVCFLLHLAGRSLLIAGDTLWGGYSPRIGSDIEAWTRSLDRLLLLDFDLMVTGHTPPRLIRDAKGKLAAARTELGVFFNPWFKAPGGGAGDPAPIAPPSYASRSPRRRPGPARRPQPAQRRSDRVVSRVRR